MHKVFGEKIDVTYLDRKGAYLIPINKGKIGVVQTSKGMFFLGGGIDENETDVECIHRECLEETGHTSVVKIFLCSAETYTHHPQLGYFHPIQRYYVGELKQNVQLPLETDHTLVWLTYEELKGNMFVEMQNWALEQYHNCNKGGLTK